jgi:hypothetical protein
VSDIHESKVLFPGSSSRLPSSSVQGKADGVAHHVTCSIRLAARLPIPIANALAPSNSFFSLTAASSVGHWGYNLRCASTRRQTLLRPPLRVCGENHHRWLSVKPGASRSNSRWKVVQLSGPRGEDRWMREGVSREFERWSDSAGMHTTACFCTRDSGSGEIASI